ncbi:MAG: Crp/Fnr family transcriptional regulator [Deltaproteobacteria bacterium]|nr:Crp/Fnr family transcriptional regulator [Deltaproteobacteria bacterium]
MEDRKRVLSKLDLFAGLSDRELSEVALITRRKSLHDGDLLFHKGDEGGDLYVIVSWRLKAFATGPGGDEILFRFMGPGEVTGDLGAFAEGKRTASNMAVGDCELLMIHRRELVPLLRRMPDIAVRLVAALATRMIKLSEALEDNNFRSVNQRLAKCLLLYADRWGKPVPGGVEIDLRLSQSELGDLVGATRESVNKAIRDWRNAGALDMHERTVTIRNRAVLEKLIEVE